MRAPSGETAKVDPLRAALPSEAYRTFLFLVDHVTVTHPEMPLVAVDLHDEPGRWFRVAPAQVPGVENNLSLANMFFREFADHADPEACSATSRASGRNAPASTAHAAGRVLERVLWIMRPDLVARSGLTPARRCPGT